MEVQIFHMEAKTIKIISILLVVFILGGCNKNEETTIFVETENGKKVSLRNFYFGLIKTVKPGTIIKEGKTSDGKDLNIVYGGDYKFYIQNEIQFKPGTDFGATWLPPHLDKDDQIVLKFQVEAPKLPKNVTREDTASSSSFEKKITSEIKDFDFFYLELESGDALGDYKFSIFNKGKLVASNVFLIRK